MSQKLFLGLDIGTASTKAVLTDSNGIIVAQSRCDHSVERPRVGHVEMSMDVWVDELRAILKDFGPKRLHCVEGIGFSGMGPCVGVADEDGHPLAPAALYGVDARAVEQIQAINAEEGEDAIFEACDCALTSQAGGPKLRWFVENLGEASSRIRMLFMPASRLVYEVTGEYVLDRHSASQCTPMYDPAALEWNKAWCAKTCPTLQLPRLGWAGDIAGTVKEDYMGLKKGTPVIFGTIDAWAEAQSAQALEPGDLMVMYGSTLFLIATSTKRMRHPALWGTTSLADGTWNLAGGMATSGSITQWLAQMYGNREFCELYDEAASSPPGAKGLILLPYFAGERTPIQDPDARGTIIGLTLDHSQADIFRAALEGVGYGVRHNIEAMKEVGMSFKRIVAVGGGAQGQLWPQIVSDITGLEQIIPERTIGASLGDAMMAAQAVGADVDIDTWNPSAAVIKPRTMPVYDVLYEHYRKLYPATKATMSELSAIQPGI